MTYLNIALVLVVGAASLNAAEDKPVQGAMTLDGKAYRFTHAIAYERKASGEVFGTTTVQVGNEKPKVTTHGEPSEGTMVIILLSVGEATNLQARALQDRNLARNARHLGDVLLLKPYLELTINKSTAEIVSYQAWAANNTVSSRLPEGAVGKLKVEKKVAHGTASDSGGPLDFDVSFHIPLRDVNK